MPKKKRIEDIKNSSSKQSFGDILDKWEGKGKAKDKKGENKRVSPEYKATRSFEDILNQFEGVKPKEAAPIKAEAVKRGIPEKGEYKRVSRAYEGSSSFSDILDEFEGKKKSSSATLNPSSEPLQREEIKPASFFREREEDDERPDEVAWSIFGDNKPIERKREEKLPSAQKKESVKRVSPEYRPTEDFASILSSFEAEKGKEIITSSDETLKEERVEEVIPPATFFREKEADDERPANVAWSIFGDNKPIVRPEIKKEAPPVEDAPIKPKKEFHAPVKRSRLFQKSVDTAIGEKSFEDILKEKGEESIKKIKTMSELRLMMPQATLDLHGMVYAEAESAIKTFLDDSIEAGIEKISIIHGKGLHAENGEGVLGDLTLKIIREKGVAREFSNPKIQFGGSGALWIILKRKEAL